jgi:SAM-dependent methyltransferase
VEASCSAPCPTSAARRDAGTPLRLTVGDGLLVGGRICDRESVMETSWTWGFGSREHGPVSWDEAFADRYEEWSADMTADIAFYVGLARAADGPLVELAVGNGRVAIPVARAAGRTVTGIDASPAMLAQAQARAAAAGVELDLREGDMRDLALDEPAGLIYCPFRALLHLPSWADRRRTFERVTASLQPGGRFAWNAFAFDHQIAARLDSEHQHEPVPHTNRYAVGDNRIDIILDNGAKSSLWWATKNEWLGLIDVAGLELEALYGGFAREPFTDDSREYVFIARRPSSTDTR